MDGVEGRRIRKPFAVQGTYQHKWSKLRPVYRSMNWCTAGKSYSCCCFFVMYCVAMGTNLLCRHTGSYDVSKKYSPLDYSVYASSSDIS